MFLTRFSLRNPIALTIFYLLIFLVGAVAFFRIGRAILPPVNFPVVTVTAPYPGAAPQQIEQLIVEPLEDELDSLPNVERISASAQNGIAELSVRFHFGSDVETDRTNVQQAVNAAQPNLPADLVPPSVSKDDPSQAPILEESVSSRIVAPSAVSEIVRRSIVPALRATNGVGNVLIAGAVPRQFTIRPNAAALTAVGGTALDVFRATARANAVLPGGLLRSPLTETTIGISAAASSIERLRTVPVLLPSSTVRLSEVAAVEDASADPSVISRVDGEPAIVIFVSRAAGDDSIRTIRAARKTLRALALEYPLLRFEELRTDEPYTTAAIGAVTQTLGEGIALTVLVMLLFLRAWRNAVIAVVAIPASLCAAFIAMWVMGFTLNVLSLMGLSLTIGILVDDSIVIIEAIALNVKRGLRGERAALAGRRDLGAAAFAITLIDVAVFLPIALMNGIVGEFMREFALVIVFATVFSLLVAYTLTPLLSARWALIDVDRTIDPARLPWTLRLLSVSRAAAGWRRLLDAFNRWEEKLADWYAFALLPRALHRRGLVLSFAALTCIASLVPLFAGWIATEFSPPANRGAIVLDLTMPPGTPLARTDAAAQRIASTLLQDERVRHVEGSAGRAFNGVSDVFAGNVAQIKIILEDQNSNGDDAVRRLREAAGMPPEAEIAGAGKGMGGAAPISYSISGKTNAVDEAAARIADFLRADPQAADVRTTGVGLRPHLQLTVDAGRAELLNVSTDEAAQTARIGSGGAIAMKAREPDGLVDVLVQSNAGRTADVNALGRLTVRASNGTLVPLRALVKMQWTRQPVVIERENRRRVVTVSANTAGGAPISVVTASLGKLLADPNFLPEGTRIEPRGDIEQFLDTVTKMLAALGLSVIAVYAILALLYKSYGLPLIIMATVPLASIGAFGLLFITRQPLNLYSMLGIVLLVGLVAKNGILLVEYAERSLRNGNGALAAIQSAAALRFRPVLMTTLAMIVGMLPLALGQTVGAEYRQALGTVVIGGLSSSLLLTLFVIPVVYVGYCSRRRLSTRLTPGTPVAARTTVCST